MFLLFQQQLFPYQKKRYVLWRELNCINVQRYPICNFKHIQDLHVCFTVRNVLESIFGLNYMGMEGFLMRGMGNEKSYRDPLPIPAGFMLQFPQPIKIVHPTGLSQLRLLGQHYNSCKMSACALIV
jgi:hypothetical protein